MNESLHEMIRTNVLTATRNFHHRVESFKREIINGENNPMKVKYISYRVEFQGRGATHIHGTLWLDIEKIEEVITSKDTTGTLRFGILSNAFIKLRENSQLTDTEKLAIKRFTDMFITCTLNENIVHEDPTKGRKIVDTIKEVNCHNCTSKCQSYAGKCKYSFPRYPLKETMIVDKNETKVESDALSNKNDIYRKILSDVDDILNDPESIQFIMDQYEKGNSEEEYIKNRSKRIDLLLELAGQVKN